MPAGLSAETSLELLKKLPITALRRELDRKKVKFSKNDGKDQLQGKNLLYFTKSDTEEVVLRGLM